MQGLAYASLLLSALMCYAIGSAVIAPASSWLRKRGGIGLLIFGGLSFIPLPPQLTLIDSAADPTLASMGASFAWPGSINKTAYLVAWGVSSVAAALIGMQIWRVRETGWRESANSRANDLSPAGRARALLTLADSLEEGLDTISRTGVDQRNVEQLAEELRMLGRRHASALPPSKGEVYRLVASRLTPAIAGAVTGYILEGAAQVGHAATHA